MAAGDCGGHDSELSIGEHDEKGAAPILNAVFVTLAAVMGPQTLLYLQQFEAATEQSVGKDDFFLIPVKDQYTFWV